MQCRILLVDDEEHFRFSARLALGRSGWEVDTAADGREAIEMLLKSEEEDKNYHLVITDIVMPVMDGIELVDQMKEHHIDLPILMITGFLDSEYREALQARGISHTLEKPFMPDLLKEMVRHIIFSDGDCSHNPTT
jgi:CheY-like chemotaxis protein